MTLIWRKVVAGVILVPVLFAAGLVAFLWASYLSEKTTSGSAHGFTIGNSKDESITAVTALHKKHPQAVVLVVPPRGALIRVPASAPDIGTLGPHDQWDILLAGSDEFKNVVRLTFEHGRLVELYRHRQYFELP